MNDIIKETEELMEMIKTNFQLTLAESRGASIFFRRLRRKLSKVYFRPNNVIDAGTYSTQKIENTLYSMGFEFRQELEDKLHYFNNDTNVSVYLNPTNRKLTMTP